MYVKSYSFAENESKAHFGLNVKTFGYDKMAETTNEIGMFASPRSFRKYLRLAFQKVFRHFTQDDAAQVACMYLHDDVREIRHCREFLLWQLFRCRHRWLGDLKDLCR